MGQDARISSLRVVHVAEATAGGVRTHLRRIVPALTARGLGVDLILSPTRAEPDFDRDLQMFRDCGCRVTLCPMKRRLAPYADLLALKQVRRQLREWHTDVVHAHATKAGLIARLAAASLPGTRTVYSPHAFCFAGLAPGLRRGLAILTESWLVPITDRYVFVSEAECEMAAALLHLRSECVRIIHNGLPDDFEGTLLSRAAARAAWGIPGDALTLGVPGRLTHQKGQDWLLRALARLGPRAAPLRLCFCGAGPLEARLRRLARNAGLEGTVSWLGHVPDLERGLRAFDLVVLPSRYEGLSYVLLETLASGVPLVVSDIPANLPHPAMRRHIPAVRLEDEAALGETILAWLQDDKGRAETAAWGRAFVRREFRLETQVDALIRCYAELAGMTGSA